MYLGNGSSWVVNAKNCLMNINDFSPHQLVFGQNVKLLNVFFPCNGSIEVGRA